MKTIVYKGRERLDRGKIKDFESIPEYAKETFKRIKNVINENYPNTKCYVMGSFYWGFWDENSDFDVIVDSESVDKNTIQNKFKDIKVDVLNINRFREIEIP